MISVIKLRRVAGLADLHGVNFSFIACVLRLWFECCDFGSIVPLFGWFNFLSMDGWCFFWYRFLLPLLCFLVYRDTFFYIARYLAAKFGTYSRLSPYMSSLLWVDDSQLELTVFSLLFPVNC